MTFEECRGAVLFLKVRSTNPSGQLSNQAPPPTPF